MEIPIYKMKHESQVAAILEEMRKRCAKEFGVTLVGNRLTLRWGAGAKLIEAHMIIEHVNNGEDEEESEF
jgi:hypothetical protein